MKLKAIYLCGDKSRYGLAHLEAISESFDLVAVVIGTEKTWLKFRNYLRGGEQYEPHVKKVEAIYRFVKKNLLGCTRKFIRKSNSLDVSEFCVSKKIDLLRVDDVNNLDSVRLIKNYNFDVLLSAAYPQILKKEILSMAPKGSINFHPSLLPKFRGAHPHFWCIAKGEETSGITAHFMTEKIDDGDIVAQISFPTIDYYYSELYAKIELETPNIVKKVALFLNNDGEPKKQSAEHACYFRNDREIHRRIFWESMNALEIHNLIRTENAFFVINGELVFPLRSNVLDKNRNMTNNLTVPPGVIVDIAQDGVIVSTIDNKFVSILQFRGNRFKRKSIMNWARTHKLYIGMKMS